MADNDQVMPIKDPSADLDYGIDWLGKGWLKSGETIVTSTWAIDDATADVHNPGIVTGNTQTVVWLDGGLSGRTYRLTNHIVTTQNREDSRTLVIQCKER